MRSSREIFLGRVAIEALERIEPDSGVGGRVCLRIIKIHRVIRDIIYMQCFSGLTEAYY